MKNLFGGMKRAKARTILSVLIVLIMTISIGVCTYISCTSMMHGRGANAPDTQMTQHFDSEQSDLTGEATEEYDNNSEENEITADNKPKMPENRGRGQNSIWLVSAAVILVIGIALLFAVNFASTKKRGNEFYQIISNGVPLKAIRKQLFLEAFIVVFIIGLIGGGIATAIAQPVSNAVMTNNMPQNSDNMQMPSDMPEGFEGGKDFGGFKSENMPQDFDSENMPQKSQNGGNQDDNDKSMPQGDFKNGEKNNKNGYLISAAATVIASLLAAIISGVACYLPVGKIKIGEIENE